MRTDDGGATAAGGLADSGREVRDDLTELERLADVLPVLIAFIDADRRYRFVNRRYETWFPDQWRRGLVGRSVREVVGEAAYAAVADKIDAVLSGERLTFDQFMPYAEGGARHIQVDFVPKRTTKGQVVGFYSLVQDVTTIKQAERTLSEANQRLEQRVSEAQAERQILADLVEGTDAFVQVVGPDFRWLAINQAAMDEFERIYGVRPQVGASMLELLADRPEHAQAVKAVWGRALAGEAFVETGEFGDRAHDRRHYEMKYNPLTDRAGRQIGAYQFVYDVTQRVVEQQRLAEAERARREADALYRAYFENTPEALFIVGVTPDEGFVVEEINAAHEAGVGLRLSDIRNRRIEDILPEPAAERILETYRHVVRTGTILQYRETFDLNGQARHWDTSLVPVRDDQGRIVRLIGASRDISPQVAAEEALRQSQKMEAMGQLTGGVAHDFNNLLTPIIGALDRLQRQALGDARDQRLIDGALQSAERAKVLVQRLLSFARRQPLQPTTVDIRALVHGMSDLLASTTGPQIKVVVRVADDLPAAVADANQVEMALLNLGVNARDAMPDGGTLSITADAEWIEPGHRSKLNPGRYVHLSVADTGVGMDEATMARVVEPFFSTKGIGQGTGLGLSMAHGLASQLGGALTVQSRVGVGTCIELWLPVGDLCDVQSGDAVQAARGAVSAGTAVVVDDEDLVRMTTSDMLGELGYDVVEAASGDEALELLRGGLRPDVLVTDHLMPGMTGVDLARSARELHPRLRILIVSGFAEIEGIAADLPRLAKPFRKDDLAASLASA